MNLPLLLIISDIRSAQNIGAIMRTADAVGARVICCGVAPYPKIESDTRAPYVADRAQHLIAKTALGAEITVFDSYFSTTTSAIQTCRNNGYKICALEQAQNSVNLFDVQSKSPIALILGPEVSGLSDEILDQCDAVYEIPMIGKKESLNVAAAAAVACYQLQQTMRHTQRR